MAKLDRLVFSTLDPDGSDWNERVVVRAADGAAALTALEAVAERAMRVGRSGKEYSDPELKRSDRAETPNYAVASVGPDGPELYVDCKGEVGRRRSAALRRILREELEAAGVSDALVEPTPADVEAARRSREAPAPDDWVRYRESTPPRPPGFPDDLPLPPGDVIRCDARLVSCIYADGDSVQGWEAEVVFVADMDARALLIETAFLFREAGCTFDRGRSEVVDGRVLALASLHRGPDLVKIVVQPLAGIPGKPPWLRRVRRESVGFARVIQPLPPPTTA